METTDPNYSILINYIDMWINCYLYVKSEQRIRMRERAREVLAGTSNEEMMRQNK